MVHIETGCPASSPAAPECMGRGWAAELQPFDPSTLAMATAGSNVKTNLVETVRKYLSADVTTTEKYCHQLRLMALGVEEISTNIICELVETNT